MAGTLQPNSDANKLYINRKEGGRGLKLVRILFESRVVALRNILHKLNLTLTY